MQVFSNRYLIFDCRKDRGDGRLQRIARTSWLILSYSSHWSLYPRVISSAWNILLGREKKPVHFYRWNFAGYGNSLWNVIQVLKFLLFCLNLNFIVEVAHIHETPAPQGIENTHARHTKEWPTHVTYLHTKGRLTHTCDTPTHQGIANTHT